MKIDKKELLNALSVVKPGLSSSEFIEQSNSFCFREGKVFTFNDEIFVSCPIDLDIDGAVAADLFINFLNKSAKPEIDLEVEGNQLKIKSGRSQAGFSISAEINLPIDEVDESGTWNDLPDDFLEGIRFAAAAAGKDLNKPVLKSVHVADDLIEASDGFRIANFYLSSPLELEEFLIDAGVCGHIHNFAPNEISLTDGWVHFRKESGAVMSCRVMDEQYVDTKKWMEVEGDELTFPDNLRSILETARLFSKRESAIKESVTLKLKNKKLFVRSESQFGDWYEEPTRMDYNGDEIEFSITPYLLLDILDKTSTAIIDGKKMVFQSENWQYLTLMRG